MKACRRACSSTVRGEYEKSMSSGLPGELPREFGERPRARARRARLRARGGAVDDAACDALQDRREAEQVVGEVEVPVGQQRVGIGAAGALAVAAHVVALG